VFDNSIRPQPGTIKPEGSARSLEPGVAARIGALNVMPLAVPHGAMRVFGYRIGPVGYVTDAKRIPDDACALLEGVKVLVLNALFHESHPTHLSFDEAVAVSRRIGAERTFLTHITHNDAHADLEANLPAGVYPAFDGLQLTVE
jgi:phosphoribosyl 1,2-cyclic phosphate phosphodiesterase